MPSLVDAEGNLVQVDDAAEADALLRQGSYGLRADAPVAVFSPDGELGDVDVGDLGQMLEAGYRLAGDSEVAAYEEQLRFGDQDLRTFGEAAARGATFGLSDYAFESLGVDKADLEARARINDTASTLGEVTGVVGATIATGGLGLTGTAARGTGLAARALAATPAGLAARAGVSAGRLVQGAEATTALARVAQAARVAGAAGAVEGGLYGAAKAVNDDWLVDNDITAERVVMGGLLGSLTGGAAGAATGGLLSGAVELYGTGSQKVGQLLGRAMREDAELAAAGVGGPLPRRSLDEILDAAEPSAAPTMGMADDMLDAAPLRVAAEEAPLDTAARRGLSEETAEQAIEAMGPIESDAIASEQSGVRKLLEGARAADGGFEKAQQQAVTDIVDQGKRFLEIVDHIDENAWKAQKKAFAAQFDGWGVPIRDIETTSVVGSFSDPGRTYLKKYGRFQGSGPKVVKRVVDAADAAERQVADALARGNLGEAYSYLDDFKGLVQRASGTRDRQVSKMVRDFAEDLRMHLEKVDTWGELAELQRGINPGSSARFKRTGSDFFRGFLKKGSEVADDPFEVLSEIDGKAIGGLLNSITQAETRQQNRAFREGFRAMALDVKNRARLLGDDAMRADAAEAESIVRFIEDRMDGVVIARKAADEWKDKTELLGALPGLPSAASAAARGLGKVANAADDLAARLRRVPAEAEQSAAVAHRAAVKAEQKTQDAAEGLLANAARSTARKSKPSAKAGEVASVLGVKVSTSDPSSYERAIERVAEMRDPDSPLRSELRMQAAVAAIEAPELAQQIEAQTQRTADFLASKAGPSARAPDGDVFGHLKQPKHAASKAIKLARYAEAVQNPLGALDRLRKGEVRTEDVEALQANFPRLYQRFAQRLMAEAARVKSRPSASAERALRMVLGSGPTSAVRTGLLQELAASGIGAEAQKQDANMMAEPTVTPGNADPPEVAGAMKMRSDELMGGM